MFLRRIGSTAFWLFVVGSSVLLFPVACVLWAITAPFDRRLVALHRFTCLWGSLYTWVNPGWRVRIEGRHRIRRDGVYVLVANHQSLVDILVLFRLFTHYKWVSKIENFRVPFIGWNMSLNRYIKLRRGDRRSVEKMMRACRQVLSMGSSILMFPEGTRSRDGHLQPFKPGAFALAKEAAVPILPIVIDGSARALPKRGFLLSAGHQIRVRVLDEIPYERFRHMSVEALTRYVRDLFLRARESDNVRAPLPAR